MPGTEHSPLKRPVDAEQCLSSSPKRSKLESGAWAFRVKNQMDETNSESNDSDAKPESKSPTSTASITEPKPAVRQRIASRRSSPEVSEPVESESESESDSSSSSSSSSADSGSESEAEVDDASSDDEQMHDQSARVPSRPSTNVPINSALRARLASFIPSLKAANEDLERDIAAGKAMGLEVDSEEEGQGQYIEMNLGLGVLQEGDDGDGDGEHSSDESESSESSDSSRSSGKPTKKEKNIIRKLMGNKADLQKPKIEEMGS
ncbi:uncharacterized protein GIQ15_02523 [Arthroderma uncinatum]|uniref:uncharacterized protein n=1 Tax=Arthroderma uncinatum TaxID=74035 RepID=UPI00144A7239|nr:uncharacterized protein GIQ15_02523 [Arthroderma uncinatum]KAF3483199.1 hypothetical protein GIQ15_02523 [Arthroderma uncinatum]